MEEEITVTASKLEAALKRWDEESKAGNWQDRDDTDKHRDNAKYLMGLLR